MWDLERRGDDPIVLRGHQGQVLALAIDADGKRLASGSADGTVRVWRLDYDELCGLASVRACKPVV